MTQKRVNDVPILHVHKQLHQNIDINKIVNEFINVNQTRRNTFYVES